MVKFPYFSIYISRLQQAPNHICSLYPLSLTMKQSCPFYQYRSLAGREKESLPILFCAMEMKLKNYGSLCWHNFRFQRLLRMVGTTEFEHLYLSHLSFNFTGGNFFAAGEMLASVKIDKENRWYSWKIVNKNNAYREKLLNILINNKQ